MTEGKMTPVICPQCGHEARTVNTRYGRRDDCCGMHSWDGKPLVSVAIHEARKAFHAAFDPLWKNAEDAYDIEEKPGSDGHRKALKRIRRTARQRSYEYLSAVSGLPEPDCHGASQEDIEKIKIITEVAKSCAGYDEIREWRKRNPIKKKDAA